MSICQVLELAYDVDDDHLYPLILGSRFKKENYENKRIKIYIR